MTHADRLLSMTIDERLVWLDEQRAIEAFRIWATARGPNDNSPAQIAARLAREGWLPSAPLQRITLAGDRGPELLIPKDRK